MKKSTIIFLSIFLIIISSAYAKEKVYSGWVYSDVTLKLDSTNFKVFVSETGNSIIFNYEGGVESVDLDECKTFTSRKFCFNNSEFVEETREYKADIYIYKLKPTITVSRSVTKNLVNIGEESTFSIIIKNTGDTRATNIKFKEDLPSAITITNTKVCKKEGNDIVWSGDLSVGDTLECEYTVYANDDIDTTLSAQLEYHDGFLNKKIFSTSVHFYTAEILTIKKIAEKTTLYINQETDLRFNLTNNIDGVIENVKATIYIPSGLIVKDSSIPKIGDNYIWEGNLKLNKTQGIWFSIAGKKVGASKIEMTVDYEYNDKKIKIENIKQEITVEEEGIELTSELTDKLDIDANEDFKYTLSIENLNGNSYIKNINVEMDATIGRFEKISLNSLAVNGTKKLYDATFLIPDIDAATSYYINANVSYLTQYGDKSSEVLKISINADPIQKLTISKSFSASTIEEQGEAIVTVYVTNELNQNLEKVFLFEKFPKYITIEGQTSNYLDLTKGEKKIAYTYTVKAPNFVSKEVPYPLNTTAAYVVDGNEISFTQSDILKIKPKELDLKISKSIETGTIYIGETISTTYTITNEESETINDVEIFFTNDQYADTVNTFSSFIKKIDPGEKIIINDEKIRPKKIGSITFGGAYVNYKDSRKRNFSKDITNLKIEIVKNYIDDALVIIEKKIALPVILGEKTKIYNEVKNIGSKDVIVTIIDGEKSWNIPIKKESNTSVMYELIFDELGSMTLPYSNIEYKIGEKSLESISNVLNFKVVEEELIVDTNSTNNNNETDDDENIDVIYKKSILKKIIEWFKKVLKI
ncbi:hypothetical protein HN451_03950 [archaeon]|nr:hypothetical protein [archaeon]